MASDHTWSQHCIFPIRVFGWFWYSQCDNKSSFLHWIFSLLVALTVLLVRRFKKYLPLSEHLILSFNLSFKILFIAVALLIFFIVISNIDINLLGGYSKLNGYLKLLSSDPLYFAIRSMLIFIIIFEVYLRVVPVLAVKRFNFYYAKSLVGNTLYEQKEDEVKKIKHLLVRNKLISKVFEKPSGP